MYFPMIGRRSYSLAVSAEILRRRRAGQSYREIEAATGVRRGSIAWLLHARAPELMTPVRKPGRRPAA